MLKNFPSQRAWSVMFKFERFTAIETADLILRPFQREDAQAYYQICKDKEVMHAFGMEPHRDIEQTACVVREYNEAFQNKIGVYWAIESKSSRSLIGSIGYWRLVPFRLRGEVGAKLAKSAWAHGYMSQALSAVIAFGFELFGLHSVEANVDLDHFASLKLVNKLGFSQEGLIREHYRCPATDQFKDTKLFSVVNGKWKNQHFYRFLLVDGEWEQKDQTTGLLEGSTSLRKTENKTTPLTSLDPVPTNARQFCVIVNGYSTGLLYAREFASRGHSCIHVQARPKLTEAALRTYRPEFFEKVYIFNGELSPVVEELQKYSIACVVAGTESAVELADELSERLCLKSNGTRLSHARRNKHRMGEVLAAAGSRTACQFNSHELRHLLSWREKQGFSRVVLKPIDSAGTDNVFLCTSDSEIQRAFEQIIGKENAMYRQNEAVLIQEVLEGTEYFINTVSMRGKHHTTDIWRYTKRAINGRNFVYSKNRLISPEGRTQEQLIQYVNSVLDAMGIEFGPCHTEVMLTLKGPVIVEINSRLDGLSMPQVNDYCIGYNPIELSADAYVNEAAFGSKTLFPYRLIKHATTVYLTSFKTGRLVSIPGLHRIKQLESFFQIVLRVEEGAELKPTVDFFTAPGIVFLVHDDPEVVERDFRLLRLWEDADELFEISADKTE